MRTLTLMQLNSAWDGSIFSAPLHQTRRVVGLAFLGAAIAAGSIGFTATPIQAQSRCVSTNCGVDYYDRPVSTTVDSGVVTTQSGIGLNVRNGPGLDYAVIGGAEDGVYLDLSGDPAYADGYRWQKVTTGGWVATEYVAGGSVNASYPGNCYTQAGYYDTGCGNGNSSGGVVYPTPRPTPIPASSPKPISYRSGPYVVAVPGGDATTLYQVRRFSRVAYPDKAQQGAFINAGAFNDYNSARSLTYLLRSNKLDARVIYR